MIASFPRKSGHTQRVFTACAYQRYSDTLSVRENTVAIRLVCQFYMRTFYRHRCRSHCPNNALADSMMDEISSFVENNTEPEILDEIREIR